MDVAAEKSDKDAGEPPPLALELRRRTELRLKPLLLLFPACMDEALPQVLRHAEKIDNLNMSRKTAKEFLDKFLCERRRSGLQHLPVGQLPEWVVDENRSLCRRILGMMRKFAAESGDVSGYEEDQPPLMMSKDVFFEKMQGIYERKPERNWRHLQSAMPAVTKDTSIDVISLLADDLYLPSPFAYSLRMQHLEERVELLEKFQGDLRKTLEVTGSTSGSATSLEIAEALGTLQLTTGVHAHPELIIKRGFAKPDGDYPGDDETVTLEHFVHNLRLYPLFPALPTESSPDSTHTSMNAGGGARSTGRSLVGGAGGAYAGVGGSAALSGGARGGDGGGDDFTL
uniref:Uncharacterized protein n=1 Tax=Chromera velia CCMP2878 TaxID=1169474 RepID=A0A0G4GAZ7_9ALVE|eukprot:Cvel_4450.t1-p1 / transcript=Cvel_4450.t1 / gene=Cvel_4450 / organism=Chromera_velia_CCMP2878 / gene_product=hypothetical protein / transcript_product=hypothetical protein / location=Cvel_scaffold194:47888-53316(+) / protein_length=341 / sequence_SO=supercontig / SO=protein_coding / is_pseudo=false